MAELTIYKNTGAGLVSIDSTISKTARKLIEAQYAANTKKAYIYDYNKFEKFCNLSGAQVLPATPATVANYIAHLQNEGKSVATVLRAIAAITKLHKVNGMQSPFTGEAAATLEGMKRTTGTAQKQAPAIRTDAMAAALNGIDTTTARGKRDKAILLVGFSGCFRRSELAALTVADINFTDKGAVIRIKRSKTDQTGAGDTKAIPFGRITSTCPIYSLQEWLNVYKETDAAPLFCSITKGDRVVRSSYITGKTVARVVKQYFGSSFSGHSLRVGFVVTARENGADMADIQTAGNWKTSAMPYHYSKQSDKWNNAAAFKLGL